MKKNGLQIVFLSVVITLMLLLGAYGISVGAQEVDPRANLPVLFQESFEERELEASDRFTVTFPLAKYLYVILLTDTETNCEWVIVQDYHGYDMNTEPIPDSCLSAGELP